MTTIIKIQRKGQVTIPTRLRIQVGLVDGDLVEAKAERGKIVLTPKLIADREYTPEQRRIIDARLAESLEDIKNGRIHGPFDSARAAITFLRKEIKARKTTGGKKPQQ
jgi:AbrB family looped-hinge helix DNA binding protein